MWLLVVTMFVKCFDFIPYFYNAIDGGKISEDYKPFAFRHVETAKLGLATLNSSTFFLYLGNL